MHWWRKCLYLSLPWNNELPDTLVNLPSTIGKGKEAISITLWDIVEIHTTIIVVEALGTVINTTTINLNIYKVWSNQLYISDNTSKPILEVGSKDFQWQKLINPPHKLLPIIFYISWTSINRIRLSFWFLKWKC